MSPLTIAQVLIGFACLAIAATLFVIVGGVAKGDHPYQKTARLLTALFLTSGMVHVCAPLFKASNASVIGWASLAAALIGAATAGGLVTNLLARRGAMLFSELERQLRKGRDDLQAISNERSILADKVAASSLELSETTQRFETTLRKAPIFVSNQDRNLRYTWVRNPPPGYAAEDMLGRSDDDIFPEAIASSLKTLKAKTLATSEHGRMEIEIEADGRARWYEIGVDPMVNQSGNVTGITTAAVDISHRKQNEKQLKLLLRDVTHRAKNVLAVVNAVARQTAMRTATKDEFVERFSARVQSLARAHDLLVSQDWNGVRMAELVRSQLSRFERLLDKRILCSGPDVTLGPEATQNLGLAIHELVHNAGKYGALSNEAGIVRISWDVTGSGGDRKFVLKWEESGGPPVVPDDRMGFGRTFIERAVGRTLDGSAKLDFMPAGVECVLEIPGYHLLRYGH